jgi:hypothetical protein
MTKLEKILKDQDVKRDIKIQIFETLIFPTVSCGSISWAVRRRKRKK